MRRLKPLFRRTATSTGTTATTTTVFAHSVSQTVRVTKLARYEDLEEQGLLLRLPCRVGATVYWLRLQESFSPIIIPCRVARYATKEDRPNKRYMEEVKLIYNGFSKRHSVTEFGKTLFLTKEEAEAALEKMKGEEHE